MNIKRARRAMAMYRSYLIRNQEALTNLERERGAVQELVAGSLTEPVRAALNARLRRIASRIEGIQSHSLQLRRSLTNLTSYLSEQERETAWELYPGQSGPEVDWSILEYPEVAGIAQRMSAKVAAKYGVDPVDLYQEATLLLAARAAWVREQIDIGYAGRVALDLAHDLEDRVRVEARRPQRVSYDALVDGQRAEEDMVSRELPDGDVPLPPTRVRTGEYGGKMMGLRWAAPDGAAGGRVTVRRVGALAREGE